MIQTRNSRPARFLGVSLPAAALVVAALSGFSAGVQAVTIDFESAPAGNVGVPYSEDGFTVTRPNGLGNWFTANPAGPVNSYLTGGAQTVRLTRTDNGLFDLLDLDVIYRATVTEYRDDVGTFNLVTSNGGSQDLSTVGHYSFTGTGFEDLSWVDMTIQMGGTFADLTHVDNIVVQNATPKPVPDAGNTGFLLSGILGILGLCHRRSANAITKA